ncbi:DsbA family protein [Candidatus Roizmanbacteria bacterium]|nr:DsbA family protein [Candidatus Roizmanbacteria bacterium]
MRQILVVLLIGAAFTIGLLWQRVQTLENNTKPTVAAGSTANPKPQQPTVGEVDPITDEDHVRGDRNARIALIEYSDLECPFCQRFHPTAQQIVDAYDGHVMWIYRHFPLEQIHSKAPKEAEAVECANELAGNEGFWALTDKIFEVSPTNNGLNLDDLPKLAAEVGINQNAFKTCLDSGKYADHVAADYQSGLKSGVSGTPGNILLDTTTGNKKLIPGALPFENFKKEIDSMLAQS